jgi:hypothetical protein
MNNLRLNHCEDTIIAPATLSNYLLKEEWVIYAPAAILRCGSRLSGSLSGIEPQFPVTRYSHRQPRPDGKADGFRVFSGAPKDYTYRKQVKVLATELQ